MIEEFFFAKKEKRTLNIRMDLYAWKFCPVGASELFIRLFSFLFVYSVQMSFTRPVFGEVVGFN